MNFLKNTGLVVAAVILFTAGYLAGGETITYNPEPDSFQKSGQVNYTGQFSKGGYHFNFTENVTLQGRDDDDTLNGVAYFASDRIDLRTKREAGEVLETCRHEVLHMYFPDYRHPDFDKPFVFRANDPIYRLEDKVDLGVCEDVVETALQRQGL